MQIYSLSQLLKAGRAMGSTRPLNGGQRCGNNNVRQLIGEEEREREAKKGKEKKHQGLDQTMM